VLHAAATVDRIEVPAHDPQVKPGRDRHLVTLALLAGQFLAAIEATAVATAMPTAVAELGGVARYSWAFSAYLLTSTTTVPLFGKLADLHGRLRIYLICTVVFLAGSALCGSAHTFNQLVFFRALQGIGAGGVIPISVTLVGDIYTLEERGKMQGLFSAVWGFASLIGPILGGIVTDTISWRWVFYFTIPFGIISAVLLQLFLREPVQRQEHKLDIMGTVLLTSAVSVLLIAILEGSEVWGWLNYRTLTLGAVSMVGVALFLRQEKRASEPMLPLDIFDNKVIAVASAGALMIGCLLFSLAAYVPVYAQGVLGGTASDAGAALIPMMLAWPLGSTLSGRMMLQVGYRPLVRFGSVVSLGGLVLLAFVAHNKVGLAAAMAGTGLGMGFIATPYLVAVQNAVPWNRRGVVTSSNQFFRTIGGAIMVAVLGAVLNTALHRSLGANGNATLALQPVQTGTSASALAHVRAALGGGLHTIFEVCVVMGVIALIIALRFPGGAATDHAHPGGQETAAAFGA
jgi:EmrB/QacA subfamily drug resistance transporter